MKTKSLNFFDNKFRITTEKKIEAEELQEGYLNDTAFVDVERLNIRLEYLKEISEIQNKLLLSYMNVAVKYNNGESVLPELSYQEFNTLTNILFVDIYTLINKFTNELCNLYLTESHKENKPSKSTEKILNFYNDSLDNYYAFKEKLFLTLSSDVETQLLTLEDYINPFLIDEVNKFIQEDWLSKESAKKDVDFSTLDLFLSANLELLLTTYDVMSVSGIDTIPQYANNFNAVLEFKKRLFEELQNSVLDKKEFNRIINQNELLNESEKYLDDVLIYLFK